MSIPKIYIPDAQMPLTPSLVCPGTTAAPERHHFPTNNNNLTIPAYAPNLNEMPPIPAPIPPPPPPAPKARAAYRTQTFPCYRCQLCLRALWNNSAWAALSGLMPM